MALAISSLADASDIDVSEAESSPPQAVSESKKGRINNFLKY
jgi:hypothetical protein